MAQPNTLQVTLFTLLQQAPWRDRRHLFTVVGMLHGLILSGTVSLNHWIPFVLSRAIQAQSTERRFQRWLQNRRITVTRLYQAILSKALLPCQDKALYVVLDTTVLWDRYCVTQVALVYRGRSIPLAWRVKRHSSASVPFAHYRQVLEQAARLLSSFQVTLLADRGFLHAELLAWIQARPHWHCCLRYRNQVLLQRWNGKRYVPLALNRSPNRVSIYHSVYLTRKRIPVSLAIGWQDGFREPWIIVSDQIASIDTLYEYSLRFTIEEGFLDWKSNGYQWTSSRLRSCSMLHRLCFILALATLITVCQGSELLDHGQRRQVDTHWHRGYSYARLGRDWLRSAVIRSREIITALILRTTLDPEPARASNKQVKNKYWMESLPLSHHLLLSVESETG